MHKITRSSTAVHGIEFGARLPFIDGVAYTDDDMVARGAERTGRYVVTEGEPDAAHLEAAEHLAARDFDALLSAFVRARRAA